jgi:hypothetical protein
MPGAFAPRFAIEAAFLILVGVGAGYADLRPAVIVGLLAVGWILVALIELAVWRSQGRAVTGATARVAAPIEGEPEPEPEPEPVSEPEPEPPLQPAAEDEYPLRPDAAHDPSEEVEAYTRILSGSSPEERSPAQGSG